MKSNVLGMLVPGEMTFGKAIIAQDISRQEYHFQRISLGAGRVRRWVMPS